MFFNRVTQETRMRREIDAAVRAGRRRHARTINIVIHPEFPWHPGVATCGNDAAEEQRSLFAHSIKNILQKDRRAVVITYPGAAQHRSIAYDRAHAISSPDPDRYRSAIIGMLEPEEMTGLLRRTDGLHGADRFVIHGAALGRCPTQIALQLFACFEWSVFLPPSASTQPKNSPEWVHLITVERVLYQLGLLRGRMRMGFIHNTRNNTVDGLTGDLVGGKTRIFAQDPRIR